jgi:nitrite transporter NirC
METIEKVCDSAVAKLKLLNKSKLRYLISSALAGAFVGIGIILIFTIGGNLSSVNSPFTKIVMGLSFGIALSLVLMAGSDLFTGNNMIFTISTMEKKTSIKDTTRIWIFSFVGNLIGAAILSLIYAYSGLTKGVVGAFILKTAALKMHTPFLQLFLRGILCNILVCLAVWCFIKLKEETSKLIMIFWCLFAFITSGFEHSVANMTLLSISLFIPHSNQITLGGFIYNLSAVTLGNIVGGALFVGLAYWVVLREK